ncbi:MAG: polyprenol monophosphomannose synthase [Crenarchaeota archaeon]|nr:polyprenol monophosphomannose synthase [Thermoproteota archaeon]
MNDNVIVSIVVPTYNEADNIPILLEKIDEVLRGKYSYEVIIVDDNSPDRTYERAIELANRYPVRVIVRERKMGLASAAVTGFSAARGRYVVLMDADLQHPPEKIPEMINLLERGADMVIGSRYVPGGRDEGLKGFRRLVSLGARVLAWILLPETRRVRDVMSGFFAVKRELAPRETKLRGYKIILQVIKNCGRNGKICEIPIVFRRRLYGKSKLRTREIINYVIDLIRLSEYFTLKYIAIALILAPILDILNPLLGVSVIALGVVIRWLVLRKHVGIGAVSTSEIASTLVKIFLRAVTGIVPAWIVGSSIELTLIHVLRGWNRIF